MTSLIPFGSHRHGIAGKNTGDGLDFWGDSFMQNLFGTSAFSNFRVDIKDGGDHYEIDADLPGLHREMIDVSYDAGMLTISADLNEETKTEKDDFVVNERRSGHVSRSFSVEGVNEDGITAEYRDGVLKVILPKNKEEVKKSHKIEIR